MVKLSGGNYITSEKLKSGDLITLKSEGEWITSDKYKYDDGNFKKSFVMDVTFGKDDYKMRINKTSRDTLMAVWGDDTAAWVGKEVKAVIEYSRQIKANVVYLEPGQGVTQDEPQEVSPDWE